MDVYRPPSFRRDNKPTPPPGFEFFVLNSADSLDSYNERQEETFDSDENETTSRKQYDDSKKIGYKHKQTEADAKNDETFGDFAPVVEDKPKRRAEKHKRTEADAKNDETFGDLGEMNDEWETQNDKFTKLFEQEKRKEGDFFDFDTSMPEDTDPEELKNRETFGFESLPTNDGKDTNNSFFGFETELPSWDKENWLKGEGLLDEEENEEESFFGFDTSLPDEGDSWLENEGSPKENQAVELEDVEKQLSAMFLANKVEKENGEQRLGKIERLFTQPGPSGFPHPPLGVVSNGGHLDRGVPDNRIKGVVSLEELEANLGDQLSQSPPPSMVPPPSHIQQSRNDGKNHHSDWINQNASPPFWPFSNIPPNEEEHQQRQQDQQYQLQRLQELQQQQLQRQKEQELQQRHHQRQKEKQLQILQHQQMLQHQARQQQMQRAIPPHLPPPYLAQPMPPFATSIQSRQHQSRDQSNENKKQRTYFRSRRKESGERMTNSDINNVVRLHSSQLSNDDPYIEDHYYQTYLSFKKGHRLVMHHRPLYEDHPETYNSKKNGADPFANALGRIPSHSVRAPRPLLQLGKDGSDELGFLVAKRQFPERKQTTMEEENELGEIILVSVAEDQWNRHHVLLGIENGISSVIDLEDIDLILNTTRPHDPHKINALINKRRELIISTFDLLWLCSPAQKEQSVKFQPFKRSDEKFFESLKQTEIPKNPLYSIEDDEFFVKITRIPKGNRLLARILPFLFQGQIFYLLMAYLRNLSTIVNYPKTQEEMSSSSRLCFLLVKAISGFLLAPLTSLLQIFIKYHQVEALKTKSGILVLRALFTQAHQVKIHMISRLQKIGGINSPETIACLSQLKEWDDTFAVFMWKLQGYFCALLRLSSEEEPEATENGSIFVEMAHVWDFLLLLTLHTSPEQKEDLFEETRDLVEQSISSPLFQDVIVALLMRLGRRDIISKHVDISAQP